MTGGCSYKWHPLLWPGRSDEDRTPGWRQSASRIRFGKETKCWRQLSIVKTCFPLALCQMKRKLQESFFSPAEGALLWGCFTPSISHQMLDGSNEYHAARLAFLGFSCFRFALSPIRAEEPLFYFSRMSIFSIGAIDFALIAAVECSSDFID